MIKQKMASSELRGTRRADLIQMTVRSTTVGFPVAQSVKNLPAMCETWVQSLGWEDPLEEDMAIHSSIIPWTITMDRGAWWATVGLRRVGHD